MIDFTTFRGKKTKEENGFRITPLLFKPADQKNVILIAGAQASIKPA